MVTYECRTPHDKQQETKKLFDSSTFRNYFRRWISMEYVYLRSKMSATAESFIHYYPSQYKTLVRGLDDQRRQGLMCDVLIKVQGTEFKAHSAVLAACSDYFNSAAPTFQPGQHRTVNLPNVTPEGFEQVLDFVYTASLRLSAANVLDVLSAASYVHMHEVVRICTDFIKTRFEMKPKESQSSNEASPRTSGNLSLEAVVNALSSTVTASSTGRTPPSSSTSTSTASSNNRPVVSSPQSTVHTSPQSSTSAVDRTSSHVVMAANRDTPVQRGNLEPSHEYQESPSTSQTPSFQVKTEPPDVYEDHSMACVQNSVQQNNMPFPEMSSTVGTTSESVSVSRTGLAVPAMETGPVGDLAAVSSIVHNVFASQMQGAPNHLILGGGMELDATTPAQGVNVTHMGNIERPSPNSHQCSDVGASKEPDSGAVITWRVVNPEDPLQTWYECGICRKPFRDLDRLHKHKKLHAPGGPKNHQRPFKCSMCHAFFTTRSTLETHWRRHSGERPFKCKTCSASFTQRSNLKRHIRVHTGEKPYQCQVCDMRFTQSNSLKAHYGFKHFQDGGGMEENQHGLPSPGGGAV